MTNTEKYFYANTNANDCGRLGDAFECACREFTSHRSVAHVAKQGKIDATFTYTTNGKTIREKFEYKTACGEVEMNAGYTHVIYCPEVFLKIEAQEQAFVFTRDEWERFLTGYPGRGAFLRYDAKRGHNHIQSFRSEGRPKASAKIAEYIWNECYEHPTLQEYVEMRRGR